MFGKNFDLIVSIEGFNEHYAFYEDHVKKIYYPAGNFNISTSGFYMDTSFSRIILKLLLSYKNLANKYSFVENSHFHSLSYRIFKIIVEKIILVENQKRQNFSRMWKYDKTQLKSFIFLYFFFFLI